jgi:hypothetical protein
MPCVSRFYGIAVYFYPDDHNPPHFHGKYAGQDVMIEIETLDVIAGGLPTRAMRLLLEWAALHRGELMANWERMRAGQATMPMEPLV